MSDPLIYGVYDETRVSLLRRPADVVCETLEEALAEMSSMILDGAVDRAAVYVCRYIVSRDGAWPMDDSACIALEVSGNWKRISDET
jgi:hypothetical protein